MRRVILGWAQLMGGATIVGLICFAAGGLLCLKFAAVFAGMTRAIKAAEALA